MYTDEQMLRELKGLLAIKSIAGEDVTPQAPYGQGVARALEYTLDLCRRLGMQVTNRDGKVAWAEIGQGDEMIAVVPHVDVVPAGEGWSVEPFAGTEKDGRLYGRGSSDNKGPAVACIFAAADLLASGRPLNRRIRLIFGQCEEVGVWGDMDYYRAHEEKPVAGFTPDAEFPALCGEKGMLWLDLSLPVEQSGVTFLEGGTASNMVAASCRAGYIDENGQEVVLETAGRAAHATVPHQGVNAITLMMHRLAAEKKAPGPLVEFYEKYLGDTFHGEKLDCCFSDEQSGITTLCSGLARTEDGRVHLYLDLRYPVTADGQVILQRIEQAAAEYGFAVQINKNAAPMYRPATDPVLVQVLSAYREETGDMSDPLVIGGGTYARALDNIVGFGAAFPGHQHTEHQKDEYILLEDLYCIRRIYRRALEKFLTM